MTWPPLYSVKTSKRARHVNFKISISNGLEVTVPRIFNHDELPGILYEKRRWIEKHLNQVSKIKAKQAQISKPDMIVLPTIEETWQVNYENHFCKPKLYEDNNFILNVIGFDISDEISLYLIKKWLKQKARHHLCAKLLEVASEMQLEFNQVTIRDQKTRWGSCSSKKNINLNYKLLLLPDEIARYVMIHELVHTKHLNHSRRFWKLVSHFDSNHKMHDKALNRADELLPVWIVA